ncbi:MAG: glycoside hydrolase domain-containing protein [Kofleriaceae bacterium]
MTIHLSRAIALAAILLGGCLDDGALSTSEQAVGPSYGVDYSWARPSLDTLHANGYTFVSRYLSYDTSGKNITAGEAAVLRASGFDIVLNWEQSANAALQGYNRGVSDAQAAVGQAAAIGAPPNLPIYFSIDFDAQASQQGAIDAYFDGVAAVIGRGRTGAYGGYYLIQRLFDHGKIAYAWQTYAWSGGHWDPRAQVRQIQNGILGGAADLDYAIADDFGQWGFVDDGPPPAAPPVPTACGAIEPGHGLSRGQAWSSCDGRFTLAMQGDGNLVLYSGGAALWATGTTNGAVAVMQGDGNFVLYSDHSHPLFASGTDGNPGAWLAIQTDGNAVVYGASALWASGTGGLPGPGPASCGALQPGESLVIGQVLGSCGGHYALAQQGDGNLVLYRDGTAIWSTGTVGTGARFLAMQGDGNLVLYGGDAIWASGTSGYGGAWLAVQDDGNLVLYAGDTAVWASNTAGW